ncbi:MAG: PP2C family serine/threonine-protein phosphatase, partial [Waddliaceae bacterium]
TLSETDLYNALTRVFILLNDLWASDPLHQSPHENDSGTTATVAIIISQKALWVANVGDSRAVLGQDGLAIQLSEDAKPTLEKYYYEILYRGGNILWGRVDGNLDMARSVGDVNHPSVSARPTIKKFDLGKLPKNKQNLLIIACDGLWSVVDPQMAIDAIKGKSATEAAEHLKILAYTKGSWDNVTIMTVDLSSS